MLLCTKIRLQVGAADAAALEVMQSTWRGLCNWWIIRLRDGERWLDWSEAKARLQASKAHDPEPGVVSGKLLHEVYVRLDTAMNAFFRRAQAGETPGCPRVRPRHVYFTRCYPAMYVKVEGTVSHSQQEEVATPAWRRAIPIVWPGSPIQRQPTIVR
jgi:putative transposase